MQRDYGDTMVTYPGLIHLSAAARTCHRGLEAHWDQKTFLNCQTAQECCPALLLPGHR